MSAWEFFLSLNELKLQNVIITFATKNYVKYEKNNSEFMLFLTFCPQSLWVPVIYIKKKTQENTIFVLNFV